MLKTETIFSQGIAPSNHFFRQQCLQKSFPPSGPKSYKSLEIGSPSYFFSFKLLIKDNSIAKTFIKQPLPKLFGFQFRNDWDARYICRKFIRLLYFHQNCHHLGWRKETTGMHVRDPGTSIPGGTKNQFRVFGIFENTNTIVL